MVDRDNIDRKLAAARTRLILDHPFLGALVLRLPMFEAEKSWCPTTATDARSFYFNPDYIDALDISQVQFVLAHEALHCALSHFARRSHRMKARWDLACDFAINPILLVEGLKPPPGMMLLPQYDGMTAEEIYPMIDENTQDETIDRHLYDDLDERTDSGSSGGSPNQSRNDTNQKPEKGEHGESSPSPSSKERPQQQSPKNTPQPTEDGQRKEPDADSPNEAQQETPQPSQEQDANKQPPPLNEVEKEQLAMQWRQRLASAEQQARQAGKMSKALARLVAAEVVPKLPWRALLARYMVAIGRDDYNYSRPSRREGSAIFPSLRSGQVEVLVVIDTSGSISGHEMQQFLSEVNSIKAQVRARILLQACDDLLAEDGPWIFEAWDEIRLPKTISGGRGTSFEPIFEWVKTKGKAPDLLVYFTDAKGKFPRQEPPYPVIWLVKGNGAIPFGQRIQLN